VIFVQVNLRTSPTQTIVWTRVRFRQIPDSFHYMGSQSGEHGQRTNGRSQRKRNCNARASAVISFSRDPTKGPIASLQEFVQCIQLVPLPQSHSVLQWSFESRGRKHWDQEFRATVAFVIDGVPHHALGGWQPSKKNAQRDTADRALGLFVGQWGDRLQSLAFENKDVCPRATKMQRVQRDHLYVLKEFERFVQSHSPTSVSWRQEKNEEGCQAIVRLRLLGATHYFIGSHRSDWDAAVVDTAQRLLWYLQCPGFEDIFEVHAESAVAQSRCIPRPPPHWEEVAGVESSCQ